MQATWGAAAGPYHARVGIGCARMRGCGATGGGSIDGPRIKRGAAQGALADQRWLGLDWDEGPDVGGPHGPYAQTARLSLFAEALGRLRARGLVYACVCTRREVEEAASAPHAGSEGPAYPGTCRGRFASAEEAARAAGRAPAWRLSLGAAVEAGLADPGAPAVAFEDVFAGPQRFDVSEAGGAAVGAGAPGAGRIAGDFVVAKGSGEPAHQLAVVVDDALMGVTEVVRGDDLLPSTPRQILLYRALGNRRPRFLHAPLVIGADGRRLAKRHGDTTIASYRRAGVPPERIAGALARTLGIEVRGGEAAPRDLVGAFDLARVPRRPIVFEEELRDALGVNPRAASPPARP